MFTVVAQKNLGDAESYFDEHLSQNDYYSAGEIRPGQWIGAGAERLRLTVEVTREQFHALCENRNPANSERLTQRQLKEGQRRVFYDFTCSAPKSVSVLEKNTVAPPEKLSICFAAAEVTVLGSGPHAVARKIQKCDLNFVKAVDPGYAVAFKPHVSVVTISFTKENV